MTTEQIYTAPSRVSRAAPERRPAVPLLPRSRRTANICHSPKRCPLLWVGEELCWPSGAFVFGIWAAVASVPFVSGENAPFVCPFHGKQDVGS